MRSGGAVNEKLSITSNSLFRNNKNSPAVFKQEQRVINSSLHAVVHILLFPPEASDVRVDGAAQWLSYSAAVEQWWANKSDASAVISSQTLSLIQEKSTFIPVERNDRHFRR